MNLLSYGSTLENVNGQHNPHPHPTPRDVNSRQAIQGRPHKVGAELRQGANLEVIVCAPVHDPFPRKKKSTLRRGQCNLTFLQLYLIKKNKKTPRQPVFSRWTRTRTFKSCGSQNVKDACELADARISTSKCRCSDSNAFVSDIKRISHQGWRRGSKTPPAAGTILFLKQH